MTSSSGTTPPSTSLIIGAIVMVALPLIIGIGLISMLVMSRTAQQEVLPTLVNTQASLPTASASLAQATQPAAAPATATVAQALDTQAAGLPTLSATATPSGSEAGQPTATLSIGATATNAGNVLSTATATTTSSSGITATPLPPTSTPTTSIQATSTATATSSPTLTATPAGAGIVVKGLRWHFDAEFNLVRVVGEITNNTNAQQLIETLSGVFYSAPGVVVNTNDIIEFSPQEVIPVGGTVPFYFELDGISSLSSYTATVETEQSPFVTRTDLVLLEPSERTNDEGERCFDGKVRNPGDRLQTEAVVTVVIYDDQNNLVNFNFQQFDSGAVFSIFGDRTRSYAICVRPPHSGRAELRVYGR